MQIQDKLRAGLRSYASVRLLTQITSWLGTVYVVRHLNSTELGRFGIALVVFNYLSMTYDGSLVEALIQHPPESDEERRAAFTMLVSIGLLLSAMTALAAGAIGRWVGDEAVTPLVIGIAAALVVTSFSVLPQARLARQMDFRRLAIIGAIQAVATTVCTVGLVSRGVGAWALVGGQIVGAVVRTAMLNRYSPSLFVPTQRVAAALRHVRFGGVLFVDNLLWRWYTSLDTLLLGRWVGTTQLGFYNLAQQVAELPLEKISTVVNDVSLPAYAELRQDPRASQDLLRETIRTHATIGFAIFWGLAAVSSVAIAVLFGTRWRASVVPLAALAAVAPLRLIGSVETPAMTGIGRPSVLVRSKLIVAPAMTLGMIAGCRAAGIRGAAFVWLMVFPLAYLGGFRLVLRAAGLSIGEIWTVIRGPLFAATVMASAAFGICYLGARSTWIPLFTLLAAILTGVMVYAIALRIFDPAAFDLMRIRLRRFLVSA